MTYQSKETLSVDPVDLVEEDEPFARHHYTISPEYLSVDVVAYDRDVFGRPLVQVGHNVGRQSAVMHLPPQMAREVAASLIACADHLEGGAA